LGRGTIDLDDEVSMAWKGGSSGSYTGGSGQMAVISELLHRKCNAAIPHIDVGTDVFAFRDDREDVARIQVKTAPGTRYRKARGYSATFNVPLAQLERTDNPPLYYAFAVRLDDAWGDFVVISRTKLQGLWNEGCGSENQGAGELTLRIQFRRTESLDDEPRMQILCGGFDLTKYLNAWEDLPPLKPLAEIEA
jgi:hypothetical protein